MADYLRGHEIKQTDTGWVYSNTKEPTVANWRYKPCGYCGQYNTAEGHDGCLGTLPGVMNACCGHGQNRQAYVQFLDGYSVHGMDAMEIMEILKRGVRND